MLSQHGLQWGGEARYSLGPLLISFWTEDFTTGFPTQFPDHGVGCHLGEDTEVSGCHFRELRGSAGPKCAPLCRCMIFVTQTCESSLLHREERCKSICHCTPENTFRQREVLWMTLKKEQKPMFPPPPFFSIIWEVSFLPGEIEASKEKH